jgi:hypothetical protein
MTGLLEFNARAALCRQLAEVEPDSKNLWLAEAERWSRLTQKPGIAADALHAEPAATWCWEVMPKPKHRAINAVEVQFGLRGVAQPAGKDTFEEFLIRTLQ